MTFMVFCIGVGGCIKPLFARAWLQYNVRYSETTVNLCIFAGFRKEIHNFSILDIIPPSDYFITYEGSTTHPSCEETVTWIIINKPIHVTKDQVSNLP